MVAMNDEKCGGILYLMRILNYKMDKLNYNNDHHDDIQVLKINLISIYYAFHVNKLTIK